MSNRAHDLSRALAGQAERVCRTYLSKGRKIGSYWCVGDVHNTPGKSLFVRLAGPTSGPGAAGKWTDAATGQHGDLLDLLGHALQMPSLSERLREAERFLHMPGPTRTAAAHGFDRRNAVIALLRRTRPIAATLAEAYLRGRGLHLDPWPDALRFHPRCLYRADDQASRRPVSSPALVSVVTTTAGEITGLQRTWLDAASATKASFTQPRRSLGTMRGQGVRLGQASSVIAVGEGLETTLSILTALPALSGVATLSASNLPVVEIPGSADSILIAADKDEAGLGAAASLQKRLQSRGLTACVLRPTLKDFNDDLIAFGSNAVRRSILSQVDERLASTLQAL